MEQQTHPSQFLTLIKSDLPKTERIRQLLLMVVRHELDKQLPASSTNKDGKELDGPAKEYRDKSKLWLASESLTLIIERLLIPI